MDAPSPEIDSIDSRPLHLEIVAHCVQYAAVLSYQISSLVAASYPPQTTVTYTLFYTSEDASTVRTIAFFSALDHSKLRWKWWELPRTHVNRRAIGRNLAAQATQADWVWFIDADYCFGPRSLFSLTRLLPDQHRKLLFPRCVRSTYHAVGDRLISEAQGSELALRALSPGDFSLKMRNSRAFGGVQIARGDICREKGYLPGHPIYQQPSLRWVRTRDDVAFRGSLGTRGHPIHAQEIYRIRHSKKGRDDPSVQN